MEIHSVDWGFLRRNVFLDTCFTDLGAWDNLGKARAKQPSCPKMHSAMQTSAMPGSVGPLGKHAASCIASGVGSLVIDRNYIEILNSL